MRHRIILIAAAALSAALPGCMDPHWSSRLEAADEMSDPQQRQLAYADIALDAADAGQPDVAEAALDRMRPGDLHDDSAAEIALMLDARFPDEAVDIAEEIGDRALRDATLQRLALGD